MSIESEFRKIARVTVYADATLEHHLLEQCIKLGATGYTVQDCRGKGKHELVEDPFVGALRVRIEMLVPTAVGEKILHFLNQEGFKRRAVLACLENVQVGAHEAF
jgi:hypothetical protein